MKQAGRKIYHLLGGLILLSLYHLLGRKQALILYLILFLMVLAIEVLRLSIPALNDLLFRHFSSFIRTKERKRLTGTPPYILGIGLSLFLYRVDIATTAVCFLACGDVAATTVGERYGRTRIGEKSLEGTVAFVAASIAAGFVLYSIGIHLPGWLILTGAITAAAVELLVLPINDNLLIPLASGGIMELLARYASGV